MATVHAGNKRSHQQMRGVHTEFHKAISSPHSREQSPKVTTPSRPTSAAPEQIDAFKAGRVIENRRRRVISYNAASVVLVGVRGVGKSSLGVIAASAYNYRLVESQRAFSDATGVSPASYRASHGNADFQRRKHAVLDNLLNTYTTRAIIVCSFSDLENGGETLLQDYAQSHPVIHITRDARGLLDYFKTWTLDRVDRLLLASGPILRCCSNFEFFNLSDSSQASDPVGNGRPITSHSRDIQGKYLTLKQVERDFLRLLRNVVGDHGRNIAHHSAYPLSQTEVDQRDHTFAVRLGVADVIEDTVDLEVAQTGADCVELVVLDSSKDKAKHLQQIAHAFATVRRKSILPIMLKVESGDAAQQSVKDRLSETASYCLSLGPELCSVDAQIEDPSMKALIESKAGTRIIACWELQERPPSGWNDQACVEAYLRASRLCCDLAKVTMPASCVNRSFEVNTYRAKVRALQLAPGLIAYEEGAEGRPSKCFNDTLTSVQPPQTAFRPQARPEASRLDLTAKSITEALFASFVIEPMRFYIYGRDVSYSLSPAMANAAYAACGITHSLTTFDCNDLKGLEKLAKDLNFGGAAILQPFKIAVMAMLDSVSPHARAIGAVNTVIPIRKLEADGAIPNETELIRQRNRQGPLLGLYGTNTDWIGIRSCVRRGLSPANSVRPTSTGLVCGAGGMARAAIHSLASLGCRNIFICNRTPSHAHDLANDYNGLVAAGSSSIAELSADGTSPTRVRVIESFAAPWPGAARPPTMVVCCIPADDGAGAAIDFELPAAWLASPTGGVVVEVAYKRPVTPLISQIRGLADRGWILHDGFDVLPEQAYAQFELFTGRRAPRRLMKDQVLKHYHAMTAATGGD